MIYKILAILIVIGMASAHVIPAEKPSDLIALKEKPGVVALSGADFDKIFSSSAMQLPSLGLPHFMATDLVFLEWQKGARDYLNQTPPLTSSI